MKTIEQKEAIETLSKISKYIISKLGEMTNENGESPMAIQLFNTQFDDGTIQYICYATSNGLCVNFHTSDNIWTEYSCEDICDLGTFTLNQIATNLVMEWQHFKYLINSQKEKMLKLQNESKNILKDFDPFK